MAIYIKGDRFMMKKVVVNGRWEIELPIHRADREEWYTLEGWEKKKTYPYE